MALKGKLKEIFTKTKDVKDDDHDAISQLARLGGVSEVKLPKGFAPSEELLVPSRFAALAQYLIDHANEYTGVFRKTGHKPTLTKLHDYFVNALINAPHGKLSISPAIVPATIPYDSIGYTIYEVADCFKLFLQDLPGGILGDASLFEALRKNLPPVQLKPADLELDFRCGGIEEAVDAEKIAKILRDSSGRERRNLILLIFGVLAVVRNNNAQIEAKEANDPEMVSKIPGADDAKSAKSVHSTEFSLSRIGPKKSELGGLSQELKRIASQDQFSAEKGTFVDPLEFRARSQSVTSTSRPPTPPSQSSHRAPSPSSSIRPALHPSRSTHSLRQQESDTPSRPSLRRMKTSGSIRKGPVYTDPTAPPALPGARDAILAGLVPESSSWASEGPSKGMRRVRANSTGFSRYPAAPDTNISAETPSSVPGHSYPSPSQQTSNLSSSKSTMTSAALATIFAPHLLGDLTKNIVVEEPAEKPDEGGSGTCTPGCSQKKSTSPVRKGLRQFLKKKGADKGVELDKANQQIRVAAWVVELLVRDWEAIVAEYGKGMEGVDAVVDGLWNYD